MAWTQFLWNTLVAGSIYALVTTGFVLTYNVGGFFNMAHGAAFLVGAYAGYTAYRVLDLGLPLTFLLAGLCAGTFALLLRLAVFERLERQRSSKPSFFLASLGILIAVEGLVAACFGNEILVFEQGLSATVDLPGGRITRLQLVILGVAVAVFLSFYWFFRYTDSGRLVRAVSDDPSLAEVMGLPVRGVVRRAFFYGSAMAGMAGVCVGLDRTVRPGSGMVSLFWAMAAAILGGVGNFSGALLGALLLACLENLTVTYLPTAWKNTVVFSAVVVFFLWRPQGLAGTRR